MGNERTAVQVAADARAAKPHIRYAANTAGNAVAAWTDGRWVAVASRVITGGWMTVPFEILVNGSPLFAQGEWCEVGQ